MPSTAILSDMFILSSVGVLEGHFIESFIVGVSCSIEEDFKVHHVINDNFKSCCGIPGSSAVDDGRISSGEGDSSSMNDAEISGVMCQTMQMTK